MSSRGGVCLSNLLVTLEQRLSVLSAEEVVWDQAVGRVLAEPVVASSPLPAFARAAMDGFAVQSTDLAEATAERPCCLRITGKAYPARPYLGEVAKGTAIRIMTGAPIPVGADAVVMLEDCEVSPDNQWVYFRRPVAPGRHVIAVGEDVAQGQLVLQAGRRLRPSDVALLVALGLSRCRVVRCPRVGLILTGPELVPPGCPPAVGQIVDSNSPMLAALIDRDGGRLVWLQRLPDERQQLLAVVQQALQQEIDLLLFCGGSSRGDEDFVPQVAAACGELVAHGLALKPGAPTGFAWLFSGPPMTRRLPAVLLPGNPVACLVAYELLAGRIVRRLAGRSWELPHRRRVLPLRDPVVSQPGRLDWVRVRFEQGRAVPLLGRGASSLFSLAEADGFLLVPENVAGYSAETPVEVYLFD
ncbi:MAG: molybdopterin molybdotransferase MoeA [Gemmataceae bacterium]|nr:molybdopterin molybdotransferase MoeA [Gemmataceae bacterium]